jgi:putative ABC transport system permease protein
MSRTGRLLSDSLRALGRNRVRTFLMTLGTFIGVAALTIIVAIGRGTQQDVMERVDRMLSGSTILLRAGGAQTRGGLHGSSGPTTTLTLRDLAIIDSTVATVEQVDPVVMARRDVTWNGRTADILVEGHSEVAAIVWNRSVTRGAFLSADDLASSARVALVGEAVVDDLFDGAEPIGEQIRIGTVPFRVIGVLERGGMDPHGIDLDHVIMVPITTMMRRVTNVDYVNHAKLGLTPGTDLDMAVLDISDVLRSEHGLGPDVPNDFAMFTPVQVQQGVRRANRVFTLFLPLVASLSILVGGFVVANLMFLTVSDRRPEIGLRKAVGARADDIRFQFLVEAAAITGLGGLAAVLTGFGVVKLIAFQAGRAAPMPWAAAGIGLLVAVVVGLVSGLAPARRAAALDPVHALR